MKRLFALPFVVLLAIPLGGCPSLQDVGSVLSASTATVNNPVTPQMLSNVENGAIIAFAGLNAYKKSCVDLVIQQSCRQTIQSIQIYTRKIKPLLVDLRNFVRLNDQVNAVIAYNALVGLIADFKTVATANNVQVQ